MNLSIKTKIILSISTIIFVSLIITFIGFMGIKNAKSLFEKNSTIQGKMDIVNRIYEGVSNTYAKVRDIVIKVASGVEDDKIKKEIEVLTEMRNQNISNIEKLRNVSGDDDIELVKKVSDSYQKIVDISKMVLSLIDYNNRDVSLANFYLLNQEEEKKNFNDYTSKILEFYEKQINESSITIKNVSNYIVYVLVIGFLALLFVSFIVFQIINKNVIKNGISLMIDSIRKLSNRELNVEIRLNRKDEIGNVVNTLSDFITSLREFITSIMTDRVQLEAIAEDLASSSTQTSASVTEITASASQIVDNMRKQMSRIDEADKTLRKILDALNNIYNLSVENKTKIDDASTAIEEMTASIASYADLTNKANNFAKDVEILSNDSNKAIETVVSSSQIISKMSEDIIEMVKLIMDIAEQTNLLAMNAAIEAAHAGEYGKGFAVVAEEIRKLADKSGNGAKKIKEVVDNITGEISKNIKFGNNARDNFIKLKSGIEELKRINEEIKTSAEEQKDANKTIIRAITVLKEAGALIAERTKKEMENSNLIKSIFDDLKVISKEVETAMEEQKDALSETNIAANKTSNIVNDIRNISKNIAGEVKTYKIK
ncbi:MAG TPA: methyl-accepting chemotaxis protein [Spirochaetota bacterium]|nr:methyl-accepting chemotaxis protein [Spirochaetota bacterium]HOM38942.1 methyl-accepting chemotaxis protein [Spirochaetota bacterium]HPQ49200.1 methyl-accepting chemotaxis protein [Spirochaetota bacterium]